MDTLSRTVAVMGADLDSSACEGLTVGDRVLVEVNGERLFGHGDNPMLADIPWTVERNFAPLNQRVQQKHKLVLSHPFHQTPLILHYVNCRQGKGPAVFSESDATISATPNGEALPFMVIMQLVSHYLPSNLARKTYTNNYCPTFLTNPESRKQILRGLTSAVSRLESGGYRYTSRSRFALRTGIRISQLNRIIDRDIELLRNIDDATLNRLGREFGWMDSLKLATTVLPDNQDTPVEDGVEGNKGDGVCVN